jgi:shikimate 5-dehydrogenase
LSDDARQLGAVNTVVFKDGRSYGHNTDWWGFAEGFRRGLPDVSGTGRFSWVRAEPAPPWPMPP